ncbi:hypothetical protein V6W59_07705 [Mannheimia sp. HC-2023]|uniref:hypothetical protein n=1 Tax=Mannheimia indoligenes TaxID=3103145 RepID=UPI002FE5D848
MELLPLKFYSLSQAVDFINQKTNSVIKESLLYSYAIEEKISFLLQIEIKDNQLVKIGRNETEGFFINEESEIHFREKSIEYEDKNQLSLQDEFSNIDIIHNDEVTRDGNDLYLSLTSANISSYKGYIVLHPDLLDLFCKESIPQHSLKNTNYLLLDEFNIQTSICADIWGSFNFKMKYPTYNEDERLYIKHTFRINFSDIKIHYDDLAKLFPSEQAYQDQEKLKKEIDKLKSELIEKEKQIAELKHQLDESNLPIMLNEFMENDRLALAIQVRKKYWSNYNSDLDNAPKADATAKEIQADYNISQKQATAIEIVACPISRK